MPLIALIVAILTALIWLTMDAGPANNPEGPQGERISAVEGQGSARKVEGRDGPMSPTLPREPIEVMVEGPTSASSTIDTLANGLSQPAVAQILGRFYVSDANGLDQVHILVERQSNDFRERWVVPKASMDSHVVGQQLVVTWTLDELQLGRYSITYMKSQVQSVNLRAGVNLIEMGSDIRSSIRLIFLDETTGAPVDVKQLTWASYQGDGPPVNFSTNIDQAQRVHHVGGSIELQDIVGESVALKVWAKSYRTKVCQLPVSVQTHFVELAPLFRVTFAFEDAMARPASAPDLAVGETVRLLIEGQELKPIQWGQDKAGTYAEFDTDTTRLEWSVIPPPGYRLVELASAGKGVGGSPLARFRRK